MQFIVCQLYLKEGRMERRENYLKYCNYNGTYSKNDTLPAKRNMLTQGYKSQCVDKKWNLVGFFHLLIMQEEVDRTTAEPLACWKQQTITSLYSLIPCVCVCVMAKPIHKPVMTLYHKNQAST